LRQVARDGHSVWLDLCNETFQGVETLGNRRTPEMQVRNMHKGGHEQRFYPNARQLQTPPCLLQAFQLISISYQVRVNANGTRDLAITHESSPGFPLARE
jgi:hypothetical protein